MKQFWLAACILAAMTAGLLWNGARLGGTAAEVTEGLVRAEAAVRAGDWTAGAALTAGAAERWRTDCGYLRTVRSHGELEEISLLLEEARRYLTCRDRPAWEGAAARAEGLLAALGEAERFSLQNLL